MPKTTIQLFVPCFVDQLYPQVAVSMVKLLEHLGVKVLYNGKQTCCGQPAFNAGFWDDAKAVCNKFINDFSADIPVVMPSASCAGFVKNYYQKIFSDPTDLAKVEALAGRTFELSDYLLNQLKLERLDVAFPALATYHDSCAALRECGLKSEPRQLLSMVKGLELVEMNDVETCCGFGGTFAVKFEHISKAMADQKLTHATTTQAQCIISTDVSCLMHLQGVSKKQGKSLKMFHLAEVLAGDARL